MRVRSYREVNRISSLTKMATYGHPYDYNLGYKVRYTDHKTNQVREEVDMLDTREEYDDPRYEIKWYVNGELTYSVCSVRAKAVYDLAIPGEALQPSEGNRWHVLMFEAAMERLAELNQYDTLTLCYQDDEPNTGLDVEKVTVTRVAYGDLQYD